MIREMHICQFALVEDQSIHFQNGMTVFTGETGAGKSLLVDALGAAFGQRAERAWLRYGADKGEVRLHLSGIDEALSAILDGQDIDADEEIVLRRVIRADGKTRAYVNGMQVNAAVLREIGSYILALHGQDTALSIREAGFAREIVDVHVSESLLKKMADCHNQWQAALNTLQELQGKREDSVRQESWLRDEVVRLQRLELASDTVEILEDEVRVGRNFHQIQQLVFDALESVDLEDTGIRARLGHVQSSVSRIADYQSDMSDAADLLAQMESMLDEVNASLKSLENHHFSQESLEQSEQRLMDIHDACKRHQVDYAGLLAVQGQLENQLSDLDSAGWDIEKAEKACVETEQAYQALASQLHQERMAASEALTKKLRPYLDQLALKGMQLRFDIDAFSDHAQWHVWGWDDVALLISSNPGEPFKPLMEVVSGGERSRFMLALMALEDGGQGKVQVFDEVDVGIGGETAWEIGKLLSSISREGQTFVISHLPQVAACADHQVMIHKEEKEGRTVSRAQVLGKEDRREEIARMLGGASTESLGHAEVLLEKGLIYRGKQKAEVVSS